MNRSLKRMQETSRATWARRFPDWVPGFETSVWRSLFPLGRSVIAVSWILVGFALIGTRAMAATVVWDGGGDGVNWTDRFNWVGDALPTASDDVQATTVTLIGGTVSVRSVQATTLTLQSVSFTVTAGASTIQNLLLKPGTTLTGTGVGTTFDVMQNATIDGANLFANAGVKIRFPAAAGSTTATLVANQRFYANGAGAELQIPGLTALNFVNNGTLEAIGGGKLDLSAVTSLTGWFGVTATGLGSQIDLSGLSGVLTGTSSASITVSDNAEVKVGAVEELNNVGLSLESGGKFPTAGLERLVVMTLRVTGMTPDFGGVTSLNGTSLSASTGGVIAMPNVTTATLVANQRWIANGVGAEVKVPGVAALNFVNNGTLEAIGGGKLDLSGVTSLTGWFGVTATGLGSQIDLSGLSGVLTGTSSAAISVSENAEVKVGAVEELNNVGLSLESGGKFPTAGLERLVGMTLRVTGMTPDFGGVTVLNGTSLLASTGVGTGGLIAMPNVTAATLFANQRWYANGAGAEVVLSGLLVYTANIASMEAYGGGKVRVPSAIVALNSRVSLTANGAGSVVDVSNFALHRLHPSSTLTETSGGIILIQRVNRPPIAVDDVAGTLTDLPIDIHLSKLLRNDSDPDGDELVLSLPASGSASGGTVALVNGRVRYTPPSGGFGEDSFVYQCSDGRGGTDTGTVRVTIRSQNRMAANLVSLEPGPSGARVVLVGIPGRLYRVEVSSDLVNWQALPGTSEFLAGPNGLFEFVDTGAPPLGTRIYRMVPN